MNTFIVTVLAVAAALLIVRELRSNPTLREKLARESRFVLTAKRPPLALVPLAALLGLLLWWAFLTLAGPP